MSLQQINTINNTSQELLAPKQTAHFVLQRQPQIKEVTLWSIGSTALNERKANCVSFQQSEVEPYLDKNIWNTLASNIPVDSMGYSKDMLPDSRDIINFVEGSQSILIDTREGIHGELVGSKDETLHLRNPGQALLEHKMLAATLQW